MKVNPITQRAKSSPYKASAMLIQGAADIAPKFVDYGADMPKGEKRKAATPPPPKEETCPEGMEKNAEGKCVEKQTPPDPETTTPDVE